MPAVVSVAFPPVDVVTVLALQGLVVQVFVPVKSVPAAKAALLAVMAAKPANT